MDQHAQRAPNSEESKGLALFGYVTGKSSGYAPVVTPKQMPAGKDKTKSLAAMFPAPTQQSNGATPPGSYVSPAPGSHVSPAPGSNVSAPISHISQSSSHVSLPPGSHPPPGSYAMPSPGSHVSPSPGSHVSPPPGSHVSPQLGSHVSPPPAGYPKVSASAGQIQSGHAAQVLLEAVVDGAGYRILCQQERPVRLMVGREVQSSDQWEMLVPCEASRSSISREHFEIRESGDSPSGYILANLSSSGTVLNGQMVQKEAPIEPGDAITIGIDQSPAAMQMAAKNPHVSRRPALQMYFIIQADGWQGHSVCAALECIYVAGRSQSQVSQLSKAARFLQGHGAAGPKSPLLRVGRAMQLQSWWENLFHDDRLVNGISREHFRIIAGEGGRPTLYNISPIGTIVNNDHLLQQQSRPLTSEDTVTILNKTDNGKLVTFRFMALDVATGRLLFEAPKEPAFQTPAAKSALAAVQNLAGDRVMSGVSAPPSDQAQLWQAAQSIGTEMSFGQMPMQVPSQTTPQQVIGQIQQQVPSQSTQQQVIGQVPQQVQQQVPSQSAQQQVMGQVPQQVSGHVPQQQAGGQVLQQAPGHAPQQQPIGHVSQQGPRALQAIAEAGLQKQSLNDMLLEAEALGTIEGESSWRLQCTAAYNQDPAHLALFGLETKHALTPPLGSSKIKIGRMVQPVDFWTKLMPYEWARSTISRECFELAYETCDEHGLLFTFTNLSNGGTLVNRKRVHSTVKVRVGDTFGVGGVQPSAGQTELLPALEFDIVCADSTCPSQRNSLKSSDSPPTLAKKGAEQHGFSQLSPGEDALTRSSVGFGSQRRRSPSPSRCVDQPFNSQMAPGQTPFGQLSAQPGEDALTQSSVGFGSQRRRSPSPSRCVDQPFNSQTTPGQTPFSQLIAQAAASSSASSPRQSPPQPVVAPPSRPLTQTPLVCRQVVDEQGNSASRYEGPLSGPLSQAPLLSKHDIGSPTSSSQHSLSRRHSQMAEELIAGPPSPILEPRDSLTVVDPIADSFGQWPSEQSTGRGSDVYQQMATGDIEQSTGRGSDAFRQLVSAQSTADTSALPGNDSVSSQPEIGFGMHVLDVSQHEIGFGMQLDVSQLAEGPVLQPKAQPSVALDKPFDALEPEPSTLEKRFPKLLDITGDDFSLPGLESQPGQPLIRLQEDQQLAAALCPPIASFGGLQENTQNIGSVPLPSLGELALAKMEESESQMWMLESSVDTTARAFDSGQLSCREAQDAVAQLEMKLVRLQSEGIDSVALSGLNSQSADEASQIKRELAQKADVLQGRLETLLRRLQGT